jgi:hypothetical protein
MVQIVDNFLTLTQEVYMPAPKGHPPYNKNGEGGRPKKWTTEVIDIEAMALEEWDKDNNNLFIQDFCRERGYHESNIDLFVASSERFSLAYNMLKMKQKSALFKGGLTKKFGFPMCSLVLSCNHGIHAKTENIISTNSDNPFSIIINNIEGNSSDLVISE